MEKWWSDKQFVRLWVCRLLAFLGDQMLSISVTVRVYRMIGTGAALGTYYVLRILPSAVLGPLAGVLIDRSDRRSLAAQGLGLSAVLAVCLYHAVSLPLTMVLALLSSTAGVLYSSSLKSLLPDVVRKERLLEANSVQSGTESIARFAAPAISAAVLGLAGTYGALLASAGAYFLGAVAILKVSPSRITAPGGSGGGAGALSRQFAEGLRYLACQKRLVLITAAVTVVLSADSAVSPLFAILLNQHLKVPPEFIGFLSSGYGAGLLLGAVAGPFLGRMVGEAGLVPLGALLIAAQMLAYSGVQAFWLTLPLQLTCGAGFALLLNGATATFQVEVPRRLIGRVVTASTAVGSLATMVAARAGGSLADSAGVRNVFMWSGLVALSGAALSLSLARPLPRRPASGDIRERDCVEHVRP